MRRIFLGILIVLSIASFAHVLLAEDFVVNSESELEMALSNAELNDEGDRIFLAPRTYIGHFSYDSSKGYPIYIMGFDPSTTILDGNNLMRVLSLRNDNGGDILVVGLTIRNGRSDTYGGGLSILTQSINGIAGDIAVFNTMIKSNEADGNGGGMWLKSYTDSGTPGSISVSYSLIQGNEAGDYGGGIYAENWASTVPAGEIKFTNNIITGNNSEFGAGAYGYSHTTGTRKPGDVVVTNNTISENIAGTNGGGIRLDGDTSGVIHVYNNIIWLNLAISGEDIFLSGFTTNYGYNNDYTSLDGTWTYAENNFDEYPFLTGDFHLKPNSPCVDAGTNSAPGIPYFDLDYQMRPYDGNIDGIAAIDIGADEYFFIIPVFDGHDFDGNGTSDISVWRPLKGRWYIKDVGGYNWGQEGDIPVNGDYNGDGTTDIAVWRPYNGKWYVMGISGTTWGTWGDIPVPGDYNGDGTTDMAVWRPSNGKWYLQGIGTYSWGILGDIPVPGDYDGDGNTDIAVWRPSNGKWYIKGVATYAWGTSGDVPVPGDYDGNGITDVAVWRPSNGKWYFHGDGSQVWGMLGDWPLVR
jgi:hypothetical protein